MIFVKCSDDNSKQSESSITYPQNRNCIKNRFVVNISEAAKMNICSKVNNCLYKRYMVYLAWTLCLILIVLLSACIYLGNFITRQQSYKVCTTDQCLRSAASLKYSMNPNVDPCDDFYEYSCGRWSIDNPERAWFPSLTNFNKVENNISATIRDFFVSIPNERWELKQVEQARILFESCMNEEMIDSLEYTALFKYLEEAGLPKLPSIFSLKEKHHAKFEFDWLRMDTKLKKLFAMDAFIGFGISPDDFNVINNVIHIGTPQGESPLPHFPSLSRLSKIFQDGEIVSKRIIEHILKTLISKTGTKLPKEEKIQIAVEIIFDMDLLRETLILNYSSRDNIGIPIKLEELQAKTDLFLLKNHNQLYPNVWKTYFDHMFEDSNVTVDFEDEDMIHVDQKEETYLFVIIDSLLKTPNIHIELYMWWMTVFVLIMNTTTDMNYFVGKQLSTLMPTSAVGSRSLYCSSVVTKFTPDVVAYSIVDRSFLNSTETKVHELLDNVREAFIKNVNHSDWLNQQEKEAISKKTKQMMEFIGYPRDLLEERLLEEKYLHLTMKRDAYLDNLMGMVRNLTPSNIQKLHKASNRTWVAENYFDVNAFYISESNAITIPLGILSFPFYDLGIQALHYGALGSVIGHELTHGFDNEGRKRDKYGNIRRWWSRPTLESFEQKAKCFVEQYGNFTLDEIGSVNGVNTLTENIADNGGLHEAFTAYKNYLANNGHENRLPGFEDFTDEQMFFLGFANLWCEETDPFIMKLTLLLDNHTPPPFRVLGPLQNSEEFAETFSCPLGSKMNPDREKCSVW